MMKSYKLFEFAIFWQPSEDAVNKGVKPEIIVSPNTILAIDIEKANILASRQIPDKYLDQLDQVTIAVRPF
jgi:hypothetical protein